MGCCSSNDSGSAHENNDDVHAASSANLHNQQHQNQHTVGGGWSPRSNSSPRSARNNNNKRSVPRAGVQYRSRSNSESLSSRHGGGGAPFFIDNDSTDVSPMTSKATTATTSPAYTHLGTSRDCVRSPPFGASPAMGKRMSLPHAVFDFSDVESEMTDDTTCAMAADHTSPSMTGPAEARCLWGAARFADDSPGQRHRSASLAPLSPPNLQQLSPGGRSTT